MTAGTVEIRERPFRVVINLLFWIVWTLAFGIILQVWYFDRSPEVGMVSFFYAAFWVAATSVFVRYILIRRPVVVADRNGLYDRRLFSQPVPWSDVLGIETRRGGLRLHLKTPFKYRPVLGFFARLLPPLKKWYATGHVMMLFGGLNGTKQEIEAAVRSAKPA